MYHDLQKTQELRRCLYAASMSSSSFTKKSIGIGNVFSKEDSKNPATATCWTVKRHTTDSVDKAEAQWTAETPQGSCPDQD